MKKCRLIKPDLSYQKDIESYRQEMLDAHSSLDGTGPLGRMENAAEWLDFNRRLESRDTLPDHWVVAEQFVYVREEDNKIVGMIQFRHEFNNFLRNFGGHIGYSVRPAERRKGYARQMLADCLNICRGYGFEDILITCVQGNEGSRRTILANGGKYERTVLCERDNVYLERYWIHL